MEKADRLDYIREMLGYKNPPTVKSICEGFSQMSSEEGDRAIDIIQCSIPFIFDFDFPFYDETKRQDIETKIIKNYYFRQICCTDVEEWKLRLSNKLNQIMPYYNEMYESRKYLVDILDDVDYERKVEEGSFSNGIENTISNQTSDSTSHNESNGMNSELNNSNKKGVSRFSDTPQGQLDSLEANTYLTNATIGDEDSNTNRTGVSSSTGDNESNTTTDGTFETSRSDVANRDRTERVKGKMGMKSKAAMVSEYRKAILNIDMEVVSRLSDLFMNVYAMLD